MGNRIRKYWIGYSDEFATTRPTEFETFVVFNEDEMLEAQHDIAMFIADDFLGENEDE